MNSVIKEKALALVEAINLNKRIAEVSGEFDEVVQTRFIIEELDDLQEVLDVNG